jgi:hypothetical protein
MWSGQRSFAPRESSLADVVEEGPCIQRHMRLACGEASVYTYLFHCVMPGFEDEKWGDLLEG